MSSQQPAAAAPPKSKSKTAPILIAAAALAVLGTVGFVLFPSSKDAEEEAPANGAAGAHGDAVSEPAGPPGVVQLEGFVVNLADPEGDRYMRNTVRLVIDSESAAQEARESELLITKLRDKIMTVLSSKMASEVTNPQGKEALRKEISATVAPLFERSKVIDVYFIEFLVQ